jgi:hypothetical protein
MNSDVRHSIVQLEPAILENFMTEVRETVAVNVTFSKSRNSSFSAAQLWNIRRNSRYGAHPRKKPTIITGLSY